MKVPKLEFEQFGSNKYEAVQEYGWKHIIYTITVTEAGCFLLKVLNADYNNLHLSLTLDDAVKRANEINESLMLLRYNRIMQNSFF